MHTPFVRVRSHLRPLAAAACSALFACAGGDSSLPDAESRAQELRATTLADATCTLHPPGDAAAGLRLASGHSGGIKFLARRTAAAAQPAVLELDCRDANGAHDIQRLDIDRMLAAEPREAPRAQATRIRPALTGDLQRISQRELDLGGYPRRPDAAPDSDVYRGWVDAVSMPMRVLEFDGASAELDFESNLPSGNWCGAVANSGPYDWASGSWNEPHITPSSGLPQYIGATWVGVGGVADNDTLIQAGTRQDYFSFLGIEMEQHQVFRQVWPQTDAHYCSDCTLQEGDRLQFSARIESSDGSNGTGVMYYWNMTQGEMASVEVAFSGGFTGSTAEWVVEDPRAYGNGLPQFGSVQFDSMQTYNDDTGFIDFGASSYDTYAINVDGHDYCTTQVLSDSSIAVTRQPD